MLLITKLVLICLIHCDAIVNSLPNRSSKDPERSSGAAFIDCNDSILLKRLLITKIPFRCLEEVSEPDDSQESNEFITSQTDSQPPLKFQLKEVVNPKSAACEDQQNCGHSANKASSSLRCRQGFTYSPVNDDCILIETHESSSTKQSSSSNPASEEGYFGISHELIGRDKCPKGTVYSSEIDLCVSIEHHPKDNQEHSYSDLSRSNSKRSILRENNDNVALKINYGELIGWSKCLVGEVYVSEVDLCL